jgi:hypothetical protein
MWYPPWPRFFREFFPAESPKAYPRDPLNAFKEEKETILPLMDAVSKEMESHRGRQVSIFREAVILIAIVTWAVNSVPLFRAGDDALRKTMGAVAAAICIISGCAGWYIIFLYRERIYHLRKRREELVSYLRPEWEDEKRKPNCNRATWLFPPIGAPTSSIAYGFVLLSVGVLAAFMNWKAIQLTCDLTGDLSEARACEKMPDDARDHRAAADRRSAGGTDLQGADAPATLDEQ